MQDAVRVSLRLLLVGALAVLVGGCGITSHSASSGSSSGSTSGSGNSQGTRVILHADDETVRRARRAGLEVASVSAHGFDMLLVANAAAAERQPNREDAPRLHVYLAGDGSPWQNRQISRRPEPRNPVALQLLLRDPSPAVLLGRPCYHLTHTCNPSLWTFERYSDRVVDALAAALTTVLDKHDAPQNPLNVTLIGYSGGGAIAVLLAQRVRAVDEVITIAAPLDIAAWADHHGFTPLVGSVNPASQLGEPRPIRELHLQGDRDEQVPPSTTAAYFSNRAADARALGQTWERIRLKNQRHQCCWVRRWPLPEVEGWLLARTGG